MSKSCTRCDKVWYKVLVCQTRVIFWSKWGHNGFKWAIVCQNGIIVSLSVVIVGQSGVIVFQNGVRDQSALVES